MADNCSYVAAVLVNIPEARIAATVAGCDGGCKNKTKTEIRLCLMASAPALFPLLCLANVRVSERSAQHREKWEKPGLDTRYAQHRDKWEKPGLDTRSAQHREKWEKPGLDTHYDIEHK